MFLGLLIRFPGKRQHQEFTADELKVFNFSFCVGPTGPRENYFCSISDARRADGQIPLRIDELRFLSHFERLQERPDPDP